MNVAIIGYGKMGKIYDKLLNANYIVDPIPTFKAVQFTNIHEFIAARPKVDLVIVSSPINSHYFICHQLLKSGHNVLCEKPVTLSSIEAKELQDLASKKKLVYYQSTVERYNPLIKFLKNNVKISEIEKISSYRFGIPSISGFSQNPVYDLAIHDVDLWFYLTNKKIRWNINVGYVSNPSRKIVVNTKQNGTLQFDLLNKVIYINDNEILDLSESSNNNPILEMVNDIIFKGYKINEEWHEEIEFLETTKQQSFTLI